MKNLLLATALALTMASEPVCAPIISIDYSDVATVQTSTTEETPFVLLARYPMALKAFECDDGYIYFTTEVFKAPSTTNSSLYLLHIETSFTPGYVARQNGVKQSDGSEYKNYRLKRGYVHLALERYQEGNARGGRITPKSFWPQSSDFTTTISSSYGGSISWATSYENGIELGNGGSIGASATIGNSIGITLSYSKSESTVTDDPMLSAQYSPENPMEAQWNFEVLNEDVAGKATYTLDTYYLFEMDKSYANADKDAFVVKYSLLFVGQYELLWNWLEGWEFPHEIELEFFVNSES